MRIIDLSGPEGNAFNIMGMAYNWCIQLADIDPEKFNEVQLREDFDNCKTYKEILDTFDKYFETMADYEFLNDPR